MGILCYRFVAVGLIAVLPIASDASARFDCFEDVGTKNSVCIDPMGVIGKGEIRSAKLYTTSLNKVEISDYQIVVYCENGSIELRNGAGIVFSRTQPFDTKVHFTQIRKAMCSVVPSRSVK